jgi:hypothetical protein
MEQLTPGRMSQSIVELVFVLLGVLVIFSASLSGFIFTGTASRGWC